MRNPSAPAYKDGERLSNSELMRAIVLKEPVFQVEIISESK